MKYLFYAITLCLSLIMFLFIGCMKHRSESSLDAILSDISFDKIDDSDDCIVYINENDEIVPYLVLTSDYNGQCLLLRYNLLSGPHIYNLPNSSGSYYENSNIDIYLNNDFLNLFSADFQNVINDTDIDITAKQSIGINGRDTTTINRKIFLLSYTELGGGNSRTNLKEGFALKFFNDSQNRIALYENGTAGSWWTRTPNTSEFTLVCGITEEGNIELGGIYSIDANGCYYNGVRPAFCLSGDLPIHCIDNKFYLGDY